MQKWRGCFAGQTEIEALSHVTKHRIEVHQVSDHSDVPNSTTNNPNESKCFDNYYGSSLK